MKRYALELLKEWQKSANRKPLLLYGARQVGKTWLVRDFAAQNYDNFLELNFFKQKQDLSEIFDGNLIPEKIIRDLEVKFQIKIDPARTLLFFDEIQESQGALDSLKIFNDVAPQYNIISAGSFLGVANRRQPVGQTDHLTLYPMSFCEFLDAHSEFSRLVPIIKERDPERLGGIVSSMLKDALRQYFYVGGMPEVVKEYVASGDWKKTRQIQYKLLDAYRQDFAKHINDKNTAERVRMLWDSIPLHLAKENKKFVYKNVKVGGRAAEFEIAMQWLMDTGLIYKIHKVETPKIPLAMHYEQNHFKLYMLDIGLFCAKADVLPADLLLQGADIVSNMHGALAEQFVLQEMKMAQVRPIFYWGRSGSGTAELDFLIQANCGIVPIEVKSSTNTISRSLNVYIAENKPAQAVKSSLNQFRIDNLAGGAENAKLYSISLYLISELLPILDGK